MTVATQQLCNYPGCSELVRKGKCPEHAALASSTYNRVGRKLSKMNNGSKPKSTSSAAQGYGYDWQQVRKRALERDNHLCQDCLEKDDRVVPATEVDHVTPFGGNKKSPLRLDLKNLRSLCEHHHAQKTSREDGGFGRAPAEKATEPAKPLSQLSYWERFGGSAK